MKSRPTCDRCLVSILDYEPYAVLEIARGVFENDALTGLDAMERAQQRTVRSALTTTFSSLRCLSL